MTVDIAGNISPSDLDELRADVAGAAAELAARVEDRLDGGYGAVA